MKIFVSYSQTDRKEVINIIRVLEMNGYSVWHYDKIKSGDNWAEHIEQAITDADVAITFITHNSAFSQSCIYEWGVIDGKSRQILPIVIGNIDIPVNLLHIQCKRSSSFSTIIEDGLIDDLNALTSNNGQNIRKMANIQNDEFMKLALLSEPFTQIGMDTLKQLQRYNSNINITKFDFFNHIYVEPNFKNEFSANEKHEFEHRLFSNSNDSLLIIKGVSGAGKTTYLNYLINKCQNEINFEKIMYFNLEYVKYRPQIINANYPQSGKTSSSFFFDHILGKAFENIIDIISDVENNVIISFKEIENNGTVYSIDNYTLFNLISNAKNRYINANSEDDLRNVEANLYQELLNFCEFDDSDLERAIICALQIFTRTLYFCSETNVPSKTLITFDNIEYLVNTYESNDGTIEIIIRSLKQFVCSEATNYKISGINFSEHFKLILTVRNIFYETFNFLISGNEFITKNTIDVTDWYSHENIFKKRMSYFKQYHIIHKKQNKKSFIETLYADKKYKDIIKNTIKYATKSSISKHDLEDCISEVYTIAVKKQKELESHPSIEGWLVLTA